MIRPTKLNLFFLGVVGLLAMAVVLLRPELWWLWLGALCIYVLACVYDRITMVPDSFVERQWQLPERLYLGEVDVLRVSVRNLSSRGSLRMDLRPVAREALRHIDAQHVLLQAQQRQTLEFPLRAWRRGVAGLAALHIEWRSPLGLFCRRASVDTQRQNSTVVPNLRAVQRAGARAQNAQKYLQGLKVQRHVGDGREFDALREFQPGHDSRAIDWRASARMRELHVREFRDERNHNIVLCFDCGRLMSRHIGDFARLDTALNAAMHLSYVSLQAGDKVGLFGFDAEQRTWMAPSNRPHSLQALVDATKALPYTLNVTDFRRAITTLDEKLKRRSVIIFFTDFEGQRQGEELTRYLYSLSARHLVIVVAIGDGDNLALEQTFPRVQADLQAAIMADQLRRGREAALRSLAARGIRVVHVPPEKIAVHLINTYHDVKRRGLI